MISFFKKAHHYENIYQHFLLYFNSKDKKEEIFTKLYTGLKIKPSIPKQRKQIIKKNPLFFLHLQWTLKSEILQVCSFI